MAQRNRPSVMMDGMIAVAVRVVGIFGAGGPVWGPVGDAAVFLFFAEILADLTEHWMIIFGPILLLRVLLVKDGLYALLQRAIAR